MAEYRYTALDEHGREVTGALQAQDRSTALARLKGMGMFPMGIEVAGSGGIAAAAAPAVTAAPGRAGIAPVFGGRVSASELALLTRQLASLINAGLNLGRCLDTIVDHCENRVLRLTLEQVRQAVQGGSTLWEALAEHPRLFDELYVSLIQAGEASGQLGKVMDRLADSLETQNEYRARIRSALAYPILLLSAGASAVIFILVFLVPRFAKVFASLKKDLPAPTKVLLAIQALLTQHGLLMLIAGVVLFIAFKAWDRTEQGGVMLDRLRMRVPVLGPIVHKEAVSRFCRTMATLVQGGVPILTSFDVAERAVGNRVLRLAITQVKDAVRGGESLAPPLRRCGVFPSLVTNMIAVGEETGNLDEMLSRIADAYDAEVSNRMRQLVSLVEPAVILIMGAVIGTIVLSMLIPVMELSTSF